MGCAAAATLGHGLHGRLASWVKLSPFQTTLRILTAAYDFALFAATARRKFSSDILPRVVPVVVMLYYLNSRIIKQQVISQARKCLARMYAIRQMS
jgi:hypothetical protein